MGAFLKTIDQKIGYFYPTTRVIISIASLVLVLLPIPTIFLNIVAIGLILSIGLMHGATDHILYLNANQIPLNKSIPKAFFIKYLLTIVLMALAWWLIPMVSFILFLLVSSYHFGQTQLQYLPQAENTPIKKLTYLTWGALVLSLIVILNPSKSNELINSVQQLSIDVNEYKSIIYVLAGVFIILFAFLAAKVHQASLVFEFAELVVISIIAVKGSLLLGFALFFGLWHSLRASQVQIDKISRTNTFNWKSFLKGSLPFTSISMVGIALLLWASFYFDQSIKAEMLFLIAISILTMPHMIIYEEFYNHHDLNRKE